MGNFNDIIFAQATPLGKSGVAVIRISGGDCRYAIEALTGKMQRPRHAYFRKIISRNGQPLDDALVLWFAQGASFTGEESVEIQCHGGRAVIQSLLTELRHLPNFRDAEAGEFTRRALINGKLDLAQVEGLADLIEAETMQQQAQALQQADGALVQMGREPA